MHYSTFTFKSQDGPEVFVYQWAPNSGVRQKGVVQIAHGAAEHAGRYERFGRFLAEAGYLVVANDHRGHGRTAGVLQKAGIAGPDAWNGFLRDAHQLNELIRQQQPGIPVFLFGHSMGSLIAQQFIQECGAELHGAVLSGTFGSLGPDPAVLLPMVEQAAATQPDAPSQIFIGMFAAFNQAFEPVKTGFEWLSRDEAEVQKYVDDPWCGFAFSNGLVMDMFRGAYRIWTQESEARIPKHLPLLMVSGEMDPAGENTASVRLLFERYRGLGLQNVAAKFYVQARHEILNETNRQEVQQDILQWLDAQVQGAEGRNGQC